MDRRQETTYAARLIRRVARQLALRPEFRGEEVRDLEQLLQLDLLERLARYRADRAELTTFTERVVRHRAASLIKERKASKRGNGHLHLSLDRELEADEDGEPIELHETLSVDDYLRLTRGAIRDEETRQDLRLDFERKLACLSPPEQAVCHLLIDMTITDAAEVLGIPRTTLHGIIKRIARHLREEGMEVYY